MLNVFDNCASKVSFVGNEVIHNAFTQLRWYISNIYVYVCSFKAAIKSRIFDEGHGKFARHPNLSPLGYDNTILKWKQSEKTGFKQLVFTVKIQLLETRALATDKRGKILQGVSRNYERVSIYLFRLSLIRKRSAPYVEVVCPSVCVCDLVSIFILSVEE